MVGRKTSPETAEDEPNCRRINRTIEVSFEEMMDMCLEDVEVTLGGTVPVCLSLPKLLTILAS